MASLGGGQGAKCVILHIVLILWFNWVLVPRLTNSGLVSPYRDKKYGGGEVIIKKWGRWKFEFEYRERSGGDYSSISAYNGILDGLDSLTFEYAVLKHTSHESLTLIKQHTAPCENFRFRVSHMRSSNATSTNQNPTQRLDLMSWRQNSWNYLATNTYVSCVMFSTSAFALKYFLHLWNLLK